MASNASINEPSLGIERLAQSQDKRTSAPKMHPFLPAVLLFLRIWIVVALISFIGLAGWHFATQDQKTQQTIDASVERVLLGWQAGAKVQDFLNASQISELGKQFIVHDIILGGKVLSPTGDILTSFGVQPALTWEEVELKGETIRHYPNERIIDVSLASFDTGLTYQVILRIPGPGHAFSKQASATSLSDHIVNDSAVSAFAATGVATLFLWFILASHRQLQHAALKAAAASGNVASARLKWRRNDTIGVTAKAIDTLVARLHYVRESELAPLRHAFHKSGFPIMKFNANGRLSEANEAAARFFELENPGQLKNFDFLFTTIAENTKGTPLGLSQASDDGNYQGQIMVQTDKGNNKICFADITTMSSAEARKNAPVQVVLADATTFFTRLVMKEQEAATLGEANQEARRHHLLLQRQLEALASMSKPLPDRSNGRIEKSVFISMERLINEWYQENVDMGDRPGDFEDTALEAVSGDPEIVRLVVRQAYSTLSSKSGELAPRITIRSSLTGGGKAEFCIEHVPQRDAKRAEYQDEIMGWMHNFKAFHKALKEAEGELVSFDPNASPGKIVMRLPAFRAASHSGASSSMRKAS